MAVTQLHGSSVGRPLVYHAKTMTTESQAKTLLLAGVECEDFHFFYCHLRAEFTFTPDLLPEVCYWFISVQISTSAASPVTRASISV